MNIKLILKKILLIFLGLVLSLVFLELFLQSASFLIKHIQDYKIYHNYKKTKNSITILCIGESTTRHQYPVQLQQLLDNIKPHKFYIIDCGISAITLETISDGIESEIKKYNPDIVLFMMGINNDFYSLLECSENDEIITYMQNKQQFRIYKLILLLKMHITSLIKTYKANVFFNKYTDDSLERQITFLLKQEKFNEIVNLLEGYLKKKSDDEVVYSRLVQIYFDFLNNEQSQYKGYEMAVKALDLNFIKDKNNLYLIYKTIFEYNLKNNNYELLKFYTNKAINESIEIFQTNEAYFIYGFIKDMISDEQKKQVLSVMPRKDRSYGILAIENLQNRNFKEADKYFMLAEELRLNSPNKKTYALYKSIIKKTIIYNKKIICMQYPVRSIEPLKNMLKNEDYYDKITFISNEETFKEALKKYDYTDIFGDQFAGDFGHCTNFGNTLIAQNAAKVIIEITKK